MANRSLRPKVLRNLRRINSVAPYIGAVPPADISWRPTIPAAKKQTPIIPTPTTTTTTAAAEIIDLADTKSLFSSITTPKLLKSAVTLHVSSLGPMVDLGAAIMNSGLMNNAVTRNMILKFTEKTFYDHFCAGKDLQTASSTAAKLWSAGLSSMLDYGAEHAHDNESCDRSLEEFLRTIEFNKTLEPGQVSFVVVKITAICPPALLKRVSDLLRWQNRGNYSITLPWKLNSLPIFSNSSPLYHTPNKPDPLTRSEESDLESAYERFTKICDSASETGVPLLIDAEDTSIQPAIDYFTYSAAINYNNTREPLIFNTIQAYLKDAKDRLTLAKRAADKMGVTIGFKLVRGAYMSSERRMAAMMGAEAPIHDTIERTHGCYNECAEFMLEEVARGRGAVVLATHNVESGRMAARKAVGLGMERGNLGVRFAQLYGMAEALSYGLRNAGFRVSKYLPYGPVEQVMPYLLRRAEENRGMLSTASLDKMLMRKELVRRLTAAVS